MAAQPKARGGGDRKSEACHRVFEKPSDPSGNVPLAAAGIDKNLAKRGALALPNRALPLRRAGFPPPRQGLAPRDGRQVSGGLSALGSLPRGVCKNI
jgi:hypothetical protein